MRMLCVDPGLRGCGVAEFENEKLVKAGYVKNPVGGRGYVAHAAMGEAVHEMFDYWLYDLVLIEHPRIYPGSQQQKGDLNDIVDVAAVGAAVATCFVSVVSTVFPSDWKGQVPKQKMLARIKAAILPEELHRVQQTNKSDTEDILDAIGIGFWKLGRINARKIHND